MTQVTLPEEMNGVSYERLEDGEVKTYSQYDCGCEYVIIWEDITRGKVKEISAGEITWCEEHDPTIPRYDDEWDMETEWEEEWTEEEYETYGDE